MPQRIKAVELKSGSVVLASCESGYFVVGLDYTPGLLLTKWDPTTDYHGTRDAADARRAFYEYAGLRPRTGDPRAQLPAFNKENT